jgi:hypothetical protein
MAQNLSSSDKLKNLVHTHSSTGYDILITRIFFSSQTGTETASSVIHNLYLQLKVHNILYVISKYYLDILTSHPLNLKQIIILDMIRVLRYIALSNATLFINEELRVPIQQMQNCVQFFQRLCQHCFLNWYYLTWPLGFLVLFCISWDCFGLFCNLYLLTFIPKITTCWSNSKQGIQM